MTPARLGDIAAAGLWPALDQFGRLAWEWAVIEEHLSRAAATSAAVALFRFEDLFSRHSGALDPFLRFVCDQPSGDLPFLQDPDQAVRTVRNASASTDKALAWSRFSPAQAAQIAQFCAPGMNRHGYGGEPGWTALVASGQGPI
ncbi:MAG: hypothetical protein AAGC92_04480 [Pseudomonadota bacterium]